MKCFTVFASTILALSVLPAEHASAGDDSDLIRSAEAAAPAAVSSKAAVYAVGADGKMRTLREGSNGFWCMPDDRSAGSTMVCVSTDTRWSRNDK